MQPTVLRDQPTVLRDQRRARGALGEQSVCLCVCVRERECVCDRACGV
jgi:hypothetical protein